MRSVLDEALLYCMFGHKSWTMTESYDHATPAQRLGVIADARGKIGEAWE